MNVTEPTEVQSSYVSNTRNKLDRPEDFTEKHCSDTVTEYQNQLYNETVNSNTDFIFWR